jgi:hypothetical protein
VHEDPFLGPHRGQRDQRIVGSDERLRHGGRFFPRQPRRNARELGFVRDRVFCISAPPNDPEHAIARRPPVDACADSGDLAGDFQSRDVGGCARRRGIAAFALQQIRAVQR